MKNSASAPMETLSPMPLDLLRECMQVLEKNTVAAELHDDDTGEHCYRVGALAKELAMKKGMDPEMCTLIDLSARLHDIGKLRVPDSILLKPGRFTPDERAIMEKHCEHGWELIGEASREFGYAALPRPM